MSHLRRQRLRTRSHFFHAICAETSDIPLSVRAVELAERHDFPQIEALLARHTSQLLQKGDPLQAVEVYRMAGKATDAALLLAKLAEDAGKGMQSALGRISNTSLRFALPEYLGGLGYAVHGILRCALLKRYYKRVSCFLLGSADA